MSEKTLRVVDGLRLPQHHRELLRPDELLGGERRLPRYFFEVPSWEEAHEIRLAPHFRLFELMMVDCREAQPLLREFPHHVPVAIALLAQVLELFRREVDAPVFIAANGAYRSPAHRANRELTTHSWGTAANIFRVGDTFLDDAKSIEKYRSIASGLGVGVSTRAYQDGDDHLHIDIGFVHVTPRSVD